MMVLQTFLVFDDIDNFKEYLSGVLESVPQLRFVLGFSCTLGLCVFGRTPDMKYHGHHILSVTCYQHDLSLLMLTLIS